MNFVKSLKSFRAVILVNSSALDSAPYVDTIVTDGMTTEEQMLEYAKHTEYNTRMGTLGINNLYVLAIVVLAFIAIYMMIKRWYFNYM